MINAYPMESAPHWPRAPRSEDERRARPSPASRLPVFAVTSGQRGVGKSAIVANLAAALARRQKRILAIDADLGRSQLSRFFTVRPSYSLNDFLTGAAVLEEILIERGDGVFLLPGAPEITSMSALQKLALASELEALDQDLDIVLLDTGSGVHDAVTYFAAAAQQIIVVVTPGPAALAESYALLEALARSHREKRFYILANQVRDRAEALRLFDPLSAAALRGLNSALDLIGWVPYDEAFARAAAADEILADHAPQAPATRALTTLAERLLEPARRAAPLKGNLQFFLRRRLGEDKQVA